MKCQLCGQREAVTYVKRLVDHHVSEWFVCKECASETGLIPSLGSSFYTVFNDGFTSPFSKEQNNMTDCCPMCSTRLQDILQNGFVGCAGCYAAFYDQLSPSLRRMYGNSSHIGKIPQHRRQSSERKLTTLKQELEKALQLQEYERCAALRDRIRELEGGE